MTASVLWIGDGAACEATLAGGKGRGLGLLCEAGLRVPEAFVVTTDFFRSAVDDELTATIESAMSALAGDGDLSAVDEATGTLREQVFEGTAGHPGEDAIRAAYRQLCTATDSQDLAVAVRSSASAEDASDRSFAGEHDSYLWVIGEDEVCEQVRRCWASLFTSRAISYRSHDQQVWSRLDAMAVVVQRMVDARSAGVFMTLNPTNGDRSKVVIESLWGLGEPLVSGTANPDRFVVDKITREVVTETLVDKPARTVRDPATGRGITELPVDDDQREQASLSRAEILELVDMARTIERFAGCPQDGEFAIADDGTVFLVQSRPETVWSTKTRPRVSSAGDAMSRIVGTLTKNSPGV